MNYGPTPFFVLFKIIITENIFDFSGIRTQTVTVDCEHADHLTTTKAQTACLFSVSWGN